ncbi:MAG: hypothetical protein Q3960_05100 [Lactobacillus sp.]|nr:hypothetical protein [Lactobacillus sp.]
MTLNFLKYLALLSVIFVANVLIHKKLATNKTYAEFVAKPVTKIAMGAIYVALLVVFYLLVFGKI